MVTVTERTLVRAGCGGMGDASTPAEAGVWVLGQHGQQRKAVSEERSPTIATRWRKKSEEGERKGKIGGEER